MPIDGKKLDPIYEIMISNLVTEIGTDGSRTKLNENDQPLITSIFCVFLKENNYIYISTYSAIINLQIFLEFVVVCVPVLNTQRIELVRQIVNQVGKLCFYYPVI